MIQAVMLIALGFLAASLIGILLAPSFWSRASRLSRKKLEATLPLTMSEIEAAQDQLRASYAVRLRRLETALASAKQKAANQLVDNSRLQMQIVALKDQIGDLDLKLAERRNAATVLEQTITKRFPELDREITLMKAQLQERSYELQDLTNKLARRDEELAAAQRAATSYQDELDRLRQALEKNSADRSGRRVRRASQWDLDDYRSEYDRLNLELSKLRQQLAHFQDRDSQQVGVIKGELQKLAELILVSARPKGAPRPPELAAEPPRHTVTPEMRRERATPWRQNATSPLPLATRLKLSAQQPQADQRTPALPTPASAEPPARKVSEARSAPAKAPISPVLTILPEETVLTSAPKNSAEAGARSKILKEVVGANTAQETPKTSPKKPDVEEPVDATAPSANGTEAKETVPAAAVNGAEPEKAAALDAKPAVAGEWEDGGKAPVNDHDAEPLPDLASIVASNGEHHPTVHNGQPADLVHLGDDKPFEPDHEAEKAAAQSTTLLDRLRVAAEEAAEAEK